MGRETRPGATLWRLLLAAALVGVFIWLRADLAEDRERIRCLRREVDTLNERVDHLPRMIRTELIRSEQRMQEWFSERERGR